MMQEEEGKTMWSFILYVIAVFLGLLLITFHKTEEETKESSSNYEGDNAPVQTVRRRNDFRLSSLFAVLGLNMNEIHKFESFQDQFHSFEEVSSACKKAGLESCNLIIGVDFTASNEWQGRKSFNQNCLHKVVANKVFNPYQKVIWILGQTLQPFHPNNLIPVYGFGDSQTTDEDVFPFIEDETPCSGFQDVLNQYNEVVKRVTFSGPTSFAPIIRKATEIVQITRSYHILVIIADGQVNEENQTIDAIVEASKYPLSIIVIGVGDGPWDIMEEFDHRLPKRKFDNFNFVDYHKCVHRSKNPDAAFALQALMEIPDQYKKIRSLGYLEKLASSHESLSKRLSSRSSESPTGSPKRSPSHKPFVVMSANSDTPKARRRTTQNATNIDSSQTESVFVPSESPKHGLGTYM